MAEMPTGAVTFLFTDIEGSTRLVKQLRDRYPEVLAQHQRILRAAFAVHGGYEVDTQGDSFFVAFARARDAVLAAVEGQRELQAHGWPDGVAIKVRMGLHTGQAVAQAGRYTGLAVHRAARIGAAGHGGQILVSQATQTLVEDEEEDLHVSLRDLGDQRLKDLDRPVRIYQVVADGLADDFPPLRGDGAPPPDAVRSPWWRRTNALLGTVLATAAVVGVAAVLLLRGGGAGQQTIAANHLGVIDPRTNDVVSEVPVGLDPGPVAVGSSDVWVGNVADRTLARVDPVDWTPLGTVSLDDRTPTGIAVGASAVWVAHGLLGDVSRIDPQFGTVVGVTEVGGSAFGSPNGSVAVDRDAVWAVFGDATFARLDTQAGVVGRTLAGTQPAGVAVGGGGVWVVNSGDATVYRYDPQTFEQGPLRQVSVGQQPSAVAYGEDAVWVASTGDDAVTRIDPRAYSTTTIPVPEDPVAVAVGAGAVWVASRSGAVTRIDPATNEVVASIEVESSPMGIAFGLGYVWVTAQAAPAT